MDRWQFYQNDRGLWCWKHVTRDGETLEGKHCFDSRTDCIVDAMRHGYLAATDGKARSPNRSASVARPQPRHAHINPVTGCAP
jgi:hypothetical protein